MQRTGKRLSHLDEVIPRWQFRERHSIRIDAPPERICEAIHRVTAADIFLFRTLVYIRNFGRRGPKSILNPPPHEPVLDTAIAGGFRLLADDPPREIVVGIDVGRGIFAAMNFLIDGSAVSTETRVFASSRSAWWKFALYWAVIRGGSGFIRRMWLRAIKRQAEGTRSVPPAHTGSLRSE